MEPQGCQRPPHLGFCELVEPLQLPLAPMEGLGSEMLGKDTMAISSENFNSSSPCPCRVLALSHRAYIPFFISLRSLFIFSIGHVFSEGIGFEDIF